MSDIVLSASVRQNLLSLQSTAGLLATAQNDLATGNKVNSALDNPTNYFTSQNLNARAGDIGNLLDSIGNGVQVLQAANTGITSLQSLVSNAKSIADQVLQTSVGYDTKSGVTTSAIAGATADNLVGVSTDTTFTGAATTASTIPYACFTLGNGASLNDNTVSPAPITAATRLVGTPGPNSNDLDSAITNGSTVLINSNTITFSTAQTNVTTDGSGNYTIGVGAGSTATVQTVLDAIDAITGTAYPSAVVSGQVQINDTNALSSLGSDAGPFSAVYLTAGDYTTAPLAGPTLLSGTASSSLSVLSASFQAGDTLTVDGQTLTFEASGATGANQINVTDDVATLLGKIDGLSGASGSTVSNGSVVLHTGTASDLSITSSDSAALAALGLGGGVSQARGNALAGLTLDIGATGNGTATAITFGTGTGQISTLSELNNALATNNLQASISATSGALTITTTNNAASSTIGTIGGTASASGKAFYNLTASSPVADPTSQQTRASLVSQYNNILQQINSTAQDASYNGVNLLNGDTLKLTFDETGKSSLSIQGVSYNDAGLGLSTLTAGADFLDNNSANGVLSSLNDASSALSAEASTLGSNLSVVQIRQDFNKNLIDVLQTGASNLTLADTNELAADSQALSTRQSIAVSALSLANQSQQSVLQLLR